MSTINLGRVQGAGIFYSTASSGASVAKSTLAPNGIVPLVGDSILFPNGDLRKITAVSGTNVTCGNVETNFKERPSNVLQEVVMVNRTAGVTEGDMINLGYTLGLEQGKQYIVKYTFNEVEYESITKYEAPTGLPMDGGELCLCQSTSYEGQVMTFPLTLGISQYSAAAEDYMSAIQNYGMLFIVDKHQITGDMTYSDDEDNSSVYTRALQTANAQNAVNVEITSIEPFTEVVADKAIADGEGNNIVSTYAKQNGNYSDMSVGNSDKLGNKAASEYALETDIPNVSNFAEKTGTYSEMSVGKAKNVTTTINGKAITSIFESDGVTAKKATNVTTNINGKAISSIFESNGTTVKNATNAVVAGKLKNVKTATEWESENPVLDAGEFGYDSTYNRVKVGDGSTAWKALASLATSRFTFGTAAWGDIARISENGEAKKCFNVGDEKTIELSTGEVITVVILGFDHDYLKNGGKAGITIGMKNLLATKYPMNNTVVNNIEWSNSLMRTSTMATLLSQLPSDLQNVIKIVTKRMLTSDTSSISTEDKLFLFSEVEIYGTGRGNEGEQYEYWETVKDGTVEADRIKYLSNGSGSASSWWLRSLSPRPALFACVSSGGTEVYGEANSEEGVSFGFCV